MLRVALVLPALKNEQKCLVESPVGRLFDGDLG